MNQGRVRQIKSGPAMRGPVVYWMSRDQRAVDNWALAYAQELALAGKQPLLVCFCLVRSFLNATVRQYDFMLHGLRQTAMSLAELNIRFFLLPGDPARHLPDFVNRHRASAVITDFDPLKIKTEWHRQVVDRISIPFFEVDAHNIVPCGEASSKQEYGAYTLRPKIHRLLPDYLREPPPITRHPFSPGGEPPRIFSVDAILKQCDVDRTVRPVTDREPGTAAGLRALNYFIQRNLAEFCGRRNDPVLEATSNLSAYLHFGQVSAQRVAWEVLRSAVAEDAKQCFLEELIVRRELADNYCRYNRHYDTFDGFPAWAKDTLNAHRRDKRPYRYTPEQFDAAQTHDELWNAAQRQLTATGRMHGYMRMYWAKKILEWTPAPESAQQIAIYLNDRYQLDGRDPNGYTGIAWAIGGVHDRAWPERPVFGKIRFMNNAGCQRKFAVREYIRKNLPSP